MQATWATAPGRVSQPSESKAARAFRSVLNANGEFGSALGLLLMCVAVPAMTDPHLFGPRVLVPVSEPLQSLLDALAGCFAVMGVVQLVAILLDQRRARARNALIAAVLWASSTAAFSSIHFWGSVTLGVAMTMVNLLAAVRGRLRIQEWERVACGKAGRCENRVTPGSIE